MIFESGGSPQQRLGPPVRGEKMKVRIPVMVQDRWTAMQKGLPPTEEVTVEEDFFLDGPVTRRVAVLDFDPKTGALLPGSRFLPPAKTAQPGRYDLSLDFADSRFNQVSVLGAVLQTIHMFEEKDTLGRRVTWAFGAPQLLVIPRAGEWANALYERSSHSLQFFFFDSLSDPGLKVFTNLSHDILSHETGHAVLDGIAPDLYDAASPQSLALHEAIADLTALVMSFRSGTLRKGVLDQTGGSIEASNAFSSIAAEFGADLDPKGHAGYLRNLLNEKTLDQVDNLEPHELSEVLTGGLYMVMMWLHNTWKQRFANESGKSDFSVSGKALAVAAEQFKRMTFRALDYLPPGEVSFADYARAIIAADQASHPDDEDVCQQIRTEFVKRGIVQSTTELEVGRDFSALDQKVRDEDLDTLAHADYAAYRFVEANRQALGVPAGIPFDVRPRLVATKVYRHHEGEKEVTELILKVAWSSEILSGLEQPLPTNLEVTVGSTLAIDWSTKRVRALLTAMYDDRQREAAKGLLRRIVDDGLLRIGEQAKGPDGHLIRSYVFGESTRDVMRLRGTANSFFILRRDDLG